MAIRKSSAIIKKLFDKAFLKKTRKVRKKVHVWTGNDEKIMRKLIDLGVDVLITNYPDRLKKVLSEM